MPEEALKKALNLLAPELQVIHLYRRSSLSGPDYF